MLKFMPVEVIEVGDELGVILPAEVVARFQLKVGDTVELTEDGSGILVAPVKSQAEADSPAS